MEDDVEQDEDAAAVGVILVEMLRAWLASCRVSARRASLEGADDRSELAIVFAKCKRMYVKKEVCLETMETNDQGLMEVGC